MEVLFVNNVTRILKDRGMDRSDLAKGCDLPTVCIDRVLDHNLTLKLSMAIMIADVLDMSLDELCGRECR